LTSPQSYEEKDVKKAFKEDTKEILEDFMHLLQTWHAPLHLPVDYHAVMQKLTEEKQIGFGKIGMPLRVSLLGSMTGAGMDEIMAILGTEETIGRIQKAIAALC